MLHRSFLVAVPGIALLAACGGGDSGGTPPPPPPPTPTKLVASGLPAEAHTMVPLSPQPTVQVTDDQGRAARVAATVTAEVVSGNGAVAGGATAATDANGRAAFSSLTLGAVSGRVGTLSLRFSAPGLDPATATIDLRCALIPIQLGQTVNRSLTTGDCSFTDGSFINTFELTTSQPVTGVSLTQDGTFRSFLLFRGPNEPRFYWGLWSSTTSNRVSYRILLPAGRSRVVATSFTPGVTGNYNVAVAQAPEDIGCDFVFAASPLTTAQRLATGDCEGGGFFADFVFIGLPQGATLTASMATQSFAPWITLTEDATGEVVASGTGTTTAAITYTNTSADNDGLYFVRATSQATGGAGPYTLNLSIAYPSSAATIAVASAKPGQLPHSTNQPRAPAKRGGGRRSR